MYFVMHAVFQCDLDWTMKLEVKVMKVYDIEYDSPPPENKFGMKKVSSEIEIIIKQQRCECNKLINLKTRKSHHRKKVLITDFIAVQDNPGKKRVRIKIPFIIFLFINGLVIHCLIMY